MQPAFSGRQQPAVSQERNASQGTTEAKASTPMPNATAVKHQLNVDILEASAKVSLSAGQQSQTLLFRSVMDRINQALSPEVRSAVDSINDLLASDGYGANAIQNAAINQDNSPEATADRIVQLSTSWLQGYMAQNPNGDQDAVVKNFVDTIRGGFEKGYNDAKNILEGLKVFDGSVKSGVEKTFDLVQKGYDDFLTKTLASLPTAGGNPAAAVNEQMQRVTS
jgi:hypothetical protein